ncbi:MAG: YpbF family protein [Clostridiales bacterium]|jgi:ABC-type transport system involved in multi-copper enzyme maturation permease subunit|nr:YpbF family protein [Clostridiales bacterium]
MRIVSDKPGQVMTLLREKFAVDDCIVRSGMLYVTAFACLFLAAIQSQGAYMRSGAIFVQDSVVLNVGRVWLFWQIASLFAVGLFCASEFTNGTIRLPAGIGRSRTSVYLSGLFAASVISTFILLTVSLGVGVICFIVSGTGGAALGEALLLWAVYVGKAILLHLPYASIFLMLAFLSCDPALSIILNFITVMALAVGPNYIAMIAGGKYQYLIQYFPNYAIGAENENFLLGFAVSVAWTVAAATIGCFVFSKEDIK